MTSIAVSGRLNGRFVPRQALDAGEINSMFELLMSHFTGVDRSTFERDLLDKNWVILLQDDRGVLRGFSTLLVYPHAAFHSGRPEGLRYSTSHLARRASASGTPMTIVYSGDTIVEREWWGSPALPLTWLRAVERITPRYGNQEVYWMLLTSGFRTYRFLPVFFREFYPCVGDTASELSALRDAIAAAQFGHRYDRSTGVVRLERPQVLVPDLIEVPGRRGRDPHVAFFLERNPGYVDGDELVCLTRIADDNLTAAGRRVARSV
jgi:hypothetical protein